MTRSVSGVVDMGPVGPGSSADSVLDLFNTDMKLEDESCLMDMGVPDLVSDMVTLAT